MVIYWKLVVHDAGQKTGHGTRDAGQKTGQKTGSGTRDTGRKIVNRKS